MNSDTAGVRGAVRPAKPRTIVTADPELDDLNSVIRLLLWSNELRIEGLVYASSRFHWKGDGKGTAFFLPDREYDEPRESFRWAPGERFLHDALDAYADVHPNLLVHHPDYPAPGSLLSVVRDGNIAFEGDVSEPTPGSRLIEKAILRDDPDPLFLQAWAGTSTIARALMSIEERFGGEADWHVRRAELSRRTIITKFASQDATYDDYIRPNWPDIPVVDVMSFAWGYFARRVNLPEDAELLGADWMRRNVTGVGPLGALYRVWGDGRQMVPGDSTDFFHLSGSTADELRELGYRVWTEPRAAGEWISEGDTPNMLNLFGNGLRGHEYPGFGGWGGRAVRASESSSEWTVKDTVDATPDGRTPEEYTQTRWFCDAQRDFAARLRWSVTPAYEEANHHPVVRVAPGLDVTVSPGSSIRLTATASDPDGDALTFRWWQYREAGTHRGVVELEGADAPTVTVTLGEASGGETVHVILEVRDDGEPPLKTYARVIITVGEDE